jgi:hypothetical protein
VKILKKNEPTIKINQPKGNVLESKGIQTDDELMMGFLLDRKKKFDKMKQFFSIFEMYEKYNNTRDISETDKNGFSTLMENFSKLNSSNKELLELKNRKSSELVVLG